LQVVQSDYKEQEQKKTGKLYVQCTRKSFGAWQFQLHQQQQQEQNGIFGGIFGSILGLLT